jgi:hypothetical protein
LVLFRFEICNSNLERFRTSLARRRKPLTHLIKKPSLRGGSQDEQFVSVTFPIELDAAADPKNTRADISHSVLATSLPMYSS